MTVADLIQNDALGAAVIANAVAAFSKRDEKGMPLLLSSAVIPLVFHRQSCQQINGRKGDGGFYRVVEETPRIAAGLEDRIQKMLPQTFDALNLAVATQLVLLEANQGKLFAGSRSFGVAATEDVRERIRAAGRLGNWFAVVGPAQVCALLNLRM